MPFATVPLAEILGLSGGLQFADIGAAFIAERPPYMDLVEAGLGHLNAFEADTRHHAKLREVYGDRLTLFSDIVGDGTRQTLHIAAAASGMTSLLKPSDRGLAFFNRFPEFGAIHSTEQVQTVRLDDVAGLPDLDFLKMDIQGAELQVLTHGERRLAACSMIHLEVSFVPLYEHQPSFGEIDLWMRAHGFLPHCFTEVKRWSIAPVLRDNDARVPFNQLLEADIVYMRDPTDLAALDAAPLKTLALLAHHCYGSVDLTGRIIAGLEGRGDLAAGAYGRYIGGLNAPA